VASALHYRLVAATNVERHACLGVHLASNRAGFLLDLSPDTSNASNH
jgi:hypothetical protein